MGLWSPCLSFHISDGTLTRTLWTLPHLGSLGPGLPQQLQWLPPAQEGPSISAWTREHSCRAVRRCLLSKRPLHGLTLEPDPTEVCGSETRAEGLEEPRTTVSAVEVFARGTPSPARHEWAQCLPTESQEKESQFSGSRGPHFLPVLCADPATLSPRQAPSPGRGMWSSLGRAAAVLPGGVFPEAAALQGLCQHSLL